MTIEKKIEYMIACLEVAKEELRVKEMPNTGIVYCSFSGKNCPDDHVQLMLDNMRNVTRMGIRVISEIEKEFSNDGKDMYVSSKGNIVFPASDDGGYIGGCK